MESCISHLVFTLFKQNGVAERKNKYILDIAMTLLFHRQVQKEFWGEVILT